MYNDGGSRGGRGSDKKNFTPRTGAARRTYPMDGAGPRVGRIAQNVPRAERVDGHADEKRKSGGYAGRPVQEDPSFAERDPKKRNMKPRGEYRPARPAMQDPAMADLPESPMEQENLLVGRNPIREALRAGRPVEKLLVASGDLSGAAKVIVKMA